MLSFVFVFEAESAQATLDFDMYIRLVGDPPASVFLSAGNTGVHKLLHGLNKLNLKYLRILWTGIYV